MHVADAQVDRALPRWLRVSYGLWFVAWFAVYADYFGGQFLLWFCCLANAYVFVGCLTQRALWFSMAAHAALFVQLLHTGDLAMRVFTQSAPLGAADYMFDASRPLLVRGFSLFHVWMPLLLLYAIAKLGYDRRAFAIQTLVALCVIPIGYFAFDPSLCTNDAVMPQVLGLPFDRDFNINWVHAFHDRPEPGRGSERFWTVLIGFPLAIHLPTHLLLSWLPWARRTTKRTATHVGSNRPD